MTNTQHKNTRDPLLDVVEVISCSIGALNRHKMYSADVDGAEIDRALGQARDTIKTLLESTNPSYEVEYKLKYIVSDIEKDERQKTYSKIGSQVEAIMQAIENLQEYGLPTEEHEGFLKDILAPLVKAYLEKTIPLAPIAQKIEQALDDIVTGRQTLFSQGVNVERVDDKLCEYAARLIEQRDGVGRKDALRDLKDVSIDEVVETIKAEVSFTVSRGDETLSLQDISQKYNPDPEQDKTGLYTLLRHVHDSLAKVKKALKTGIIPHETLGEYIERMKRVWDKERKEEDRKQEALAKTWAAETAGDHADDVFNFLQDGNPIINQDEIDELMGYEPLLSEKIATEISKLRDGLGVLQANLPLLAPNRYGETSVGMPRSDGAYLG